MKIELPCKKDKCILLPICKNKEKIKCQKLHQYMIDVEKKTLSLAEGIEYKSLKYRYHYMIKIKETLPFLRYIVNMNNTYCETYHEYGIYKYIFENDYNIVQKIIKEAEDENTLSE